MAMGQFNGHFKIYLQILPSAHFSIYSTLQTHLSCKKFNISIHTLLHTFITPTQLTLYLSKPMTSPVSLGSKISCLFSRMSHFTTNSFITPLSGYRALTSPLHSDISTSILYLTLCQLAGNFTCNDLMQPILENASLLIVINFTSIRNLTKQAYPLTNPPTFTLPLTFTWITLNAFMSPSHTILTLSNYSFMKFQSIPRDARITILAYLASSPF